MECFLWQLDDPSDQSRKDHQIPNIKNQRRLARPNRQSLHHHPQQPPQPCQRQWPDQNTPNHRPKAHPMETQKTPPVRSGTNRGTYNCHAALQNCKHGQLLADYVRLMKTCGSRASETLRLKWSDLDWDRTQLIIGSDGLTKNHESRVVDFNPALETHLLDMNNRRNGSAYLFPSPKSRTTDNPTKTLKGVLHKARDIAGVEGLGFHDCRHYFISHAVMSGIDYMTIARWVGHKDGGVLIGRVYGHLNDEHARRSARKLKLE